MAAQETGSQVRLRLRRGQQGSQGPARRQGRQPRRDDQPRPAGAARLHHHHRGLPGVPGDRAGARTGWPGRSTPTWRRWSATMGRRLGDPDDPLLVSVRSGAKFSMPGMMETVLNVGLNDAAASSRPAPASAGGNDRFAWDSYRRLIQMFGKTVCEVPGEEFEHALDEAKRAKGTHRRPGPRRRRPARAGRGVQEDLRRAHRAGVPAGAARAARPGHPGGLRVVERRAGGALPPPGAHPGRPGHRGQRGGDGLRQPRPRLRHRRRLHP